MRPPTNDDSSAATRSTASTASSAKRAAAPSSSAAPTPSGINATETTRTTSNASADNVLPEGTSARTIADPIYGQPSGAVMSRGDRVEREEILRRRTTPEVFDEVMQRRDAEDADAKQQAESAAKSQQQR